MKSVKVNVQMIGALNPPVYAHDTDAGCDLTIMDKIVLHPGDKIKVGCGFSMAIPSSIGGFGLFGFVVPRSGSGSIGYSLANTVGIIDSSYRGELQLYVKHNGYDEVITLEKYDRVAQLILIPYVKADFNIVDFLDKTERGGSGWGASGTK